MALLVGVATGASCSSGGDLGSVGTTSSSTSSSTTTTSASSSGETCQWLLQACCPGDSCFGGLVCKGGHCVGQFGNACTKNEECDSSLCLQSGHCSKACANAADCPPAPEWACASLTCQCTPSGPEVCDGRDNDCDGVIDNAATCEPGAKCEMGACACDPANLCGATCKDLGSDPQNCGACGVACGGSCAAGRCLITLASGQGSPRAIAVDATTVYWTTYSGTVMKVPIGGGVPTTLVSGQLFVPGIAVDATSVYWTNGTLGGSVMKVAIGGGAPTTLASGQDNPGVVAVDATSVYWTSSSGGGSVMKVAIGGGVPTTLASGQLSPAYLAVDPTSVYWIDSFGPPSSSSSSSGAMQSGTVMRVPLAGAAPTTLASGLSDPANIAVDATSVYWTTPSASVVKVPIGGGAPTTTVSGQLLSVAGIAVDATSVYWTSSEGGGSVMKTLK